jgi:hypothetical protein
MIIQIITQFTAFYETQYFISVFTKARRRSLTRAWIRRSTQGSEQTASEPSPEAPASSQCALLLSVWDPFQHKLFIHACLPKGVSFLRLSTKTLNVGYSCPCACYMTHPYFSSNFSRQYLRRCLRQRYSWNLITHQAMNRKGWVKLRLHAFLIWELCLNEPKLSF